MSSRSGFCFCKAGNLIAQLSCPTIFDKSDEDADSFCGEDDEVFVLVSGWRELIAGVSCTDLELPALASQFLICSSTSSHSGPNITSC